MTVDDSVAANDCRFGMGGAFFFANSSFSSTPLYLRLSSNFKRDAVSWSPSCVIFCDICGVIGGVVAAIDFFVVFCIFVAAVHVALQL